MIETSVPSRTVLALPNGIRKSLRRILRFVVDLTVKMLVFEEQHRVVAADRGPQQAVGVERR